jgi:uncharacterized protein (UPF0305 family)
MKTYQKFITEKRGDTIVFTFGRFNPPTVGHEKLITAVENIAKSKGGKYLVYPSHTQDAKKNPLNQTQKIKYIRKMFPKHKRNIVASTGKHALDIAVELYDKGYTTLVMVVGSDRVQEFQRILDRYNGEDKTHGFYQFDKIEVVSAGERDPDAEGVEGMSASKMRAAAVKGDFESFRLGTPTSLSDADTKTMFNDVRKGLKLKVIKEGKKWKEIDFSYEPQEIQKTLDLECEVTYKNYTTKYMHTSPEAYNVIDEMVNSMGGLSKKDEYYLKEAIEVLDQFLKVRSEWKRTEKINQIDLFMMEQLSRKYARFMDNIVFSEYFDNSFIYKYISEISETLEYEAHIDEGFSDAVNFIMKKLKISKLKAYKIIQKATDKGIDILKLQTQWSAIAPSLVAIVSEYNPQEK